MDSKQVNQELKKEVWPSLHESGFRRSHHLRLWRDHSDRIDIIEFRHFNTNEAQRIGITAHSFQIELGCHLRYVPQLHPDNVTQRDGLPIPSPAACMLRAHLERGYREWWGPERTVWSIDREGTKLRKAVVDARKQLLGTGMPWFTQFDSPEKIHRLLATNNEEDMRRLWGFGRPGSPIRCLMLGYTARAAGMNAEATTNLERAAQFPGFGAIADRLLADARSV
jgi:hypothetical protein